MFLRGIGNGVETKVLNQVARNNQDKFMDDFYFELTNNEFEALRSNFLTTNFSKTRISKCRNKNF
jgi:hypothetical protein